MPAEIKPSLQLQINNSGAWKTIARFEVGNESRLHFARLGVENLALVDGKAPWRIATCDSYPVVLMDFEAKRGWQEREPRS